jgi:hypothetical protein
VKKKPARPTSTKQTARRARIVKGVIKGKTAATIAREEHVSRSWVAREARSPGAQALIAEMLDAHSGEMTQLLEETIAIIRESYSARKTAVAEGVVIDAGPDHYARIAGGKLYVQLLTAGRALPKAPETKEFKGATYQEIEAALVAQQAAGL